MSKRPTVLVILDGYGLNDNCQYNAVCEGKTPVIDQLVSQCPSTKDEASGMAVGLSEGRMGNPEVDHLNMGASCIVYQELIRTAKSVQDGDFFQIPELLTATEDCKKHDSALRMFGLVSDGGVHSHNTHIHGLPELAKKNGLKKVYVYCFLDGRDMSPKSGKGFAEQLEAKMKEIGAGEVASVMGRYYAMDRGKRWGRVELAYNALTKDEGNQAESAAAGTRASHDSGKADEFVILSVVMKDGKSAAAIQDKDSVIFHNSRPDRTGKITRVFCDDSFDGSPREKRLDLVYVCFTDYDETIQNKLVVLKKESTINTFGEFLAAHKKTQVRTAETEKCAHVTFLFDGGVEGPNEGRDRILAPSLKEVVTYDLKPKMSANGACDKLVETIKSDKYDVIIIDFVDPDMVGHTGAEDAAIKATEIVDACVGHAVEAIREVDGVTFICADHGNAEQLVDYEIGEPFIAHTTNPISFILVNVDSSCKLRKGGALCGIAPIPIEPMRME